MNQRVSAILNKIHDVDEVNRLLVSAFININQLGAEGENILSHYLIAASPARIRRMPFSRHDRKLEAAPSPWGLQLNNG